MLEHKITRRVFLGTSVYVVSAPLLASLPATQSSNALQKVTEPGQFFNAHELTVLADIAEIMIPKTDTPGATEAHVIPVLDALMLTWAGKETKAQYRAIVRQVEQLSLNTFKSAYVESTFQDREALITQLDERAFENTSSEISANYRKLKEMIFHIYYTSKEANPDYMLIPGAYKGCLSKEEYEAMVDERLGRMPSAEVFTSDVG
ncbi:gluconate 2-dehydrogenase subunit 3 family protein [Ningiella sp. W23]|uniref:gluconate 2-dehydrogenase subunit 3 family protein n=1 Tax=Ningiella sp. W23 TaxID=3023715 RepID=UPI0037567740